MDNNFVSIEEGNGGEEMNKLLGSLLTNIYRGDKKWTDFTSDSASFSLSNSSKLFFTTDSYVVNPIEFAGGNIGHLAVCGTINDLVVKGADPIGLSLALIIEEGFDKNILKKLIQSISKISEDLKVPIVTGDTKVMPKGKLDKIVINTSGIGIAKDVLDKEIKTGDKIIISGGIAEHAVALLSKRFDFQTNIVSDSKPLLEEMKEIRDLIKLAKDPTRGGISASLNEISYQKKIEIEIEEEKIPIKKEVKIASKMLGLDPFSLANEGKLITIVSKENSKKVLQRLKQFNKMASIIGEVISVEKESQVILKTPIGKRVLDMPSGKIVPRIC